MFIIGFALSFIKDSVDVAYIAEHFVNPVRDFIPEKGEQLQYMILTVLFPILFIAYKLILDKLVKIDGDKVYKYVGILTPISTIAIVALFIITQIHETYYMDMLRSTRSIYTCSILLALCFAAWICAMMLYEKFKKYKKAIDIVLLLATIGIAVYTAWLFICYNYSSNGSFQEHHANAYFYPVYKVYSGQTMLVDFKNIYGFYPYFLMPFFKLLGSCSEYNFSLVMSWLMFIGSMCIIYTLFSACKNRVIACMGSIATLFAAGVYALNNNGAGYYLQYFPQRYLFS
ncbi:MAG: hypothetical protein RR576_11990, partial [Oscillospiraceae bacterium]